MFLVLRCGQNCSILVWPPQRPCDLHLTKTKIYHPKHPSMLNLRSIRAFGAVYSTTCPKNRTLLSPFSNPILTFIQLHLRISHDNENDCKLSNFSKIGLKVMIEYAFYSNHSTNTSPTPPATITPK